MNTARSINQAEQRHVLRQLRWRITPPERSCAKSERLVARTGPKHPGAASNPGLILAPLLLLCALLPLSAAEKALDLSPRPAVSVLWIGVGVLGILVAVTAWNRSLALKVRARTAGLREELARRIEADKALEASEEMFSRAFRSSPDAVFLTRLSDGRVIDTNDSAGRIFNCSKEDLIGHRTVGEGWGYACAEDRDRLVSLIRGQGGTLRDHEMQMLRKSGERFTALVSCETIEVAGEKCFVGVLRDVTDQRRAQEALQRSESALGALMDALPTPAMLLEKDGRFAAANEALAHSLRCRRQELIGQVAYTMLPPEVASSRQAAIDRVFTTGQGIRFEDSNEGRHYINYLSPVLGATGAVTRVAVFALDITERKRAEQEVRESEERFSKAFHASPAIIAISTFPEGRYVDINAQFTETLGYTREEVLGRAADLEVWAQPEQRQAVFDRLARGGTVRDTECLLRTKANEQRHVLVSVERISLGTQPCLLFSHRDITDRKQAEAIQEAMVSLTTQLSAASTPTEAARVIYETADRFWQWDAGALDLYSPTEERVWAVMYLDLIEGRRREVPPSNSSERLTPRMRRVMEGGPELVLRRPSEMQASDSVAFGDKARLSASIMSVPIRSHGRFAGVLSIQSYAPNAFTDADLKLLQGLADYCGDTLERIRTTQALRQSREQFQQLFQLSPLATAIYSKRDGRIVNVNTRLLELFQYRMEEVTGRTGLELGIWCDLSARDQMLARLHRKEEVRDFEARLRGQDGQEHDLLLSAQVIELPDGPMVIVQANDITERKRAEEALRASEARLHAIVHHTPNVAVQGYNLEGRVRLWNDASTRMFGFDANSAMGKTLDQLIHTKEEAEKFVEILRGLAGTGESIGPSEYRFRRRNGDEGWCLSTIFEIPGLGGSESLFVCMDVDITARKQAEAALQESEERLRLALDAAHMGIFDWDMTSQRIVWSHWHEELWGFKPGEFPGTYEAFSQRVHPDDMPAINAEVARCLAAHEPFTQEFRVVLPDGRVRWILGAGQFEFAAGGPPRRMRGTVIEITDRKRAETERQQLLVQLLEAEDEERGRLARELHDTTAQHLAATRMNLTRLSDAAAALPAPVPQLLADSLGLVSQALHEIRTFTYLLHPPLLDELGLAGALRDYAAGFAQRSGLRASVDTEGFTGRLPPAMELALFRVAQESLGNVHRHSGSDCARIRLERDAEEVRLEIQDNGRGMPDDAPAGVGLAGMRERLRQLGGRLEIESDTEGTTVLASLPLDEVKEKKDAKSP